MTQSRIVSVRLVPGQVKPEFEEGFFEGSLDEAQAHLQARANKKEILFGQVLADDGKVVHNVAALAAA